MYDFLDIGCLLNKQLDTVSSDMLEVLEKRYIIYKEGCVIKS
ncbi:hypothetical protein [Clostridium saudiense]|nr:hypothetical protein [Clostridium saudiense]